MNSGPDHNWTLLQVVEVYSLSRRVVGLLGEQSACYFYLPTLLRRSPPKVQVDLYSR